MSDPEAISAAALATEVPAWEGCALQTELLCPDVISPVHRAVESILWKVVPEGHPEAVVKLLRPDTRAFFDPAAATAGALLASELAVGPRVIWSDPARAALAMEYLGAGWRTATLFDLQDPAVMAAVFAAIRRFQQGGALPAVFDVFAEVVALRAAAEREGAEIPADLWWMCDLVADIGAEIARIGFDPVPARNDGVSSNIMIGPEGAVRLLDYDRAAMNDPLYDIGVLLTETCAFASETEAMVALWAGQADRRIVNRCILYGCADDLMWGLWSTLCDRRSPRLHLEFRKYAEWRFLRCRTTLGDPRFEERLRNL